MYSSAAVVALIQRRIEELHGVETSLDVAAYLVDDAARDDLPGARAGIPEQLFVREQADALELALYIAPAVMQRLASDDPHRRLHAGNLESYWIALEGVSHFVMVVWRALCGGQVSLLELEIQAEVDKFVIAWQLLGQQGWHSEGGARWLGRWLFERYAIRDAVSPEEARRYRMATDVAQRYCGQLARRYGRDRTAQRLRRDAREFFHRGLADKLLAA